MDYPRSHRGPAGHSRAYTQRSTPADKPQRPIRGCEHTRTGLKQFAAWPRMYNEQSSGPGPSLPNADNTQRRGQTAHTSENITGTLTSGPGAKALQAQFAVWMLRSTAQKPILTVIQTRWCMARCHIRDVQMVAVVEGLRKQWVFGILRSTCECLAWTIFGSSSRRGEDIAVRHPKRRNDLSSSQR
ncbi:uncharacterized protein K460DRAFT_26543 [Cucurbitaria berberidis CBS 394.84]|uniref:Uncharacterized protein n=1 Tax=Cucurbitaria berberidis CBS 394.84 TaxID=1168544 RepID=A0A9P4LEE8_9PLEO|nr:uncharacterized protein K460DRAFT_26543 [Cucurbitaria berberidis CBS 394.84]KAF1851029.1 hypothetical protein K460DRAFT_26543 [Cucurbitaria berberidis CBS 394.84]